MARKWDSCTKCSRLWTHHHTLYWRGTLAPISSFESELGTTFDVQLEAPHVVDMKRQVWAGVVDTCPSGNILNSSYRTADTNTFQDGVGDVLLQCCRVVPDGILMFLPSYSLLDKLEARWKSTGLWDELLKFKQCVLTEPRGAGDAFDKTMKTHYTGIKSGDGSVLMAVFRGKVSEGLDFADGNARCVIVVGIPFPNVKDTKVAMKKQYNSAGACRGLLDGNQWYTQQAFRALNQAVGRCIRHRYDYGAILLVDERFKQERNLQFISKWVRGSLRRQPCFNHTVNALANFFHGLAADPPKAPLPPPPKAASASPSCALATPTPATPATSVYPHACSAEMATVSPSSNTHATHHPRIALQVATPNHVATSNHSQSACEESMQDRRWIPCHARQHEGVVAQTSSNARCRSQNPWEELRYNASHVVRHQISMAHCESAHSSTVLVNGTCDVGRLNDNGGKENLLPVKSPSCGRFPDSFVSPPTVAGMSTRPVSHSLQMNKDAVPSIPESNMRSGVCVETTEPTSQNCFALPVHTMDMPVAKLVAGPEVFEPELTQMETFETDGDEWEVSYFLGSQSLLSSADHHVPNPHKYDAVSHESDAGRPLIEGQPGLEGCCTSDNSAHLKNVNEVPCCEEHLHWDSEDDFDVRPRLQPLVQRSSLAVLPEHSGSMCRNPAVTARFGSNRLMSPVPASKKLRSGGYYAKKAAAADFKQV